MRDNVEKMNDAKQRNIISDKEKASKFSLDARIFVRSLSDALICTRQISEINCNKELYLQKASILDKTLRGRTLLLAKYCDHDICNPNIIACSSLNSYYTYFMMKFSVNLYLNLYDRLKNINDYFVMSKELDDINTSLKSDLHRYVNYTKRKNFIMTKDA